ncbi:winged helix-turn-helix domain-containing protein [Phytoactinopolyspora mesophila]|nr:helix-turn-helix domain-containing protein [Phytoactinopolyspora mesophila]
MPEDPPAPWPAAPDPDRDVVLDSRSLRAVAHPVRLRILGLLRLHGPSTATALAAQLGLNSGATSYHLRQLAAGGLIVEDVERGTARDRWWRAVHRSSFFQVSDLTDDEKDVGVEYLRAIAQIYAEKMHRAAEERPMLPPEWQDAASFADYPLLLTSDEAKQLLADVREVVTRYRAMSIPHEDASADAPPGAEPYHLQIQGFLSPGLELGGAPDPGVAVETDEGP